jgi:hypothetical protein
MRRYMIFSGGAVVPNLQLRPMTMGRYYSTNCDKGVKIIDSPPCVTAHNKEYYIKRMNRLKRIENVLLEHQCRLEDELTHLQDVLNDHLYNRGTYHYDSLSSQDELFYNLEEELKNVNEKLFEVKDDKFWLNLESKFQ